jgi:hypothetical protein
MSKENDPRVLTFVEALCDLGQITFGNATEAALAAGYGAGNRKSAREVGCKLRARHAKLIARHLAAGGITGETIRLHVASRFFDSKASNADVARLGKLLAEMTAGALAPQKLEHSGGIVVEIHKEEE